MKLPETRVRFAPSPTGPLHIGGVRTALYNYLLARKNNGKMILRIEDTDQGRFVPGAEEYIIESLSWCGIEFDEGVHVGGPYAPYRQSERKEFYVKYINQLLETGHAYYAFDTPEELDARRKEAETLKYPPFQYDVVTRNKLRNSLVLNEEEVKQLIANQTPYVVRIRIPENETIVLQDTIRGTVEVESNLLDDKVLFKSDGMPTYHLANVVDDYLMKITHVIRGEEWLPSAPLHVLLYRAFGWESVMPEFAHLPLLLKPDGKGKLSKRDGDRLGFPVFPLQWNDPASGEISSGYRESGYLPDAFINMLAMLGWNPGTTQEIFTMQELIDAFSLDRVSKSGAKFDADKAKWFNHQYLQNQPATDLAKLLLPYLTQKGIEVDESRIAQIISLIKERANLIPELWDQMAFFFFRPETYDEQLIKKRWKPETSGSLMEITSLLESTNKKKAEELSSQIKGYIEDNQLNMGVIMLPLRIALVGSAMGPDLFEIMEILGKDETILRIKSAIKKTDSTISTK
ncbi:MAG: glutamate--tRNA ligase [Bacteroidales bacterium]|nr:glutamate--tRNA ligase [Bacteroidales bacterium]